MPRLARFCLLALLCSVAGCTDGPTAAKPLTILDCESGSAYAIGRTISGAIDADDCLDPGGDAFADYYRFEMRTGGPVSVTVNTTATSAPLIVVLFNEELDVVDFEEFAAGGTATIGGELLPGSYFLIVAAEQAGQVGRYAMTSSNTLPPVFPCDRFIPITIGATATGAISTADCRDPINVANADYYEFTLATPGAVSFRLTPSQPGQMILALATGAGRYTQVEAATQALPAAAGGILQPGRYVVIVAGSAAGQTGGYTIASSATLPPIANVPPFLGCLTPQAYTIGTTVSGSLAGTDCIDMSETPIDRYDFTLAAMTTITFDLRSISFDPFLVLFNEAGELIAFNDDTPEGLDSRITITLPAGRYAIGATGYYTTSLGDYTLSTAVGGGSAVVAVGEGGCGGGGLAMPGCSPFADSCSSFSATAAASYSLKLLATRCQRRDGSVWRTEHPGQKGR